MYWALNSSFLAVQSAFQLVLVYTTQVNSTFRARWLASSEVISQVLNHLWAAEEKQNGFCRYIVTNKVSLWAPSYSACVVYTKTIIHLSVSERLRARVSYEQIVNEAQPSWLSLVENEGE